MRVRHSAVSPVGLTSVRRQFTTHDLADDLLYYIETDVKIMTTGYLFIDGAFFESVFSRMVKNMFPDETLFTAINLRHLTQPYDRVFYYDALPEKKARNLKRTGNYDASRRRNCLIG
jgi:hypothetical protein